MNDKVKPKNEDLQSMFEILGSDVDFGVLDVEGYLNWNRWLGIVISVVMGKKKQRFVDFGIQQRRLDDALSMVEFGLGMKKN